LIHGAGGNRLSWPPQVRRLGAARVLAVDLPGHGATPGPGRSQVADYAASIRAWMDAQAVAAAWLVGHSMGAAIALRLALDWPQRVHGLVLVGAAAQMRVAPRVLAALAHEATVGEGVDLVIHWAFHRQAAPGLRDPARRSMLDTAPVVLYGDFLASDRFDVSDRLGEIQVPALIVCGSEDRMTPLDHAQGLARGIPGAQLLVIPDAGHMVQLERPVEVAQAIEQFVTSTG
jgi:pimeloyl-ACP methyl ester carboxylesterase